MPLCSLAHVGKSSRVIPNSKRGAGDKTSDPLMWRDTRMPSHAGGKKKAARLVSSATSCCVAVGAKMLMRAVRSQPALASRQCAKPSFAAALRGDKNLAMERIDSKSGHADKQDQRPQ